MTEKRRTIKRPIDEIMGNSKGASKVLQTAMGERSELQKRMDMLSEMGQNSALSRAAKQISDHQKAIDSLMPKQKMYDPIMDNPDWLRVNSAKRAHEISEHLASIKNPIDETNSRLANIEGQFGEIHEIAIESANIANGLNAAAAEFLNKFEDAALSNEKSARIAIWTGIIAIIIAAIPAMHIIYSELWRAPQEAAKMQAIISDFKTEITELKDEHNKVIEGLADTIEKSNGSSAILLQDIKEILAKKTKEEHP